MKTETHSEIYSTDCIADKDIFFKLSGRGGGGVEKERKGADQEGGRRSGRRRGEVGNGRRWGGTGGKGGAREESQPVTHVVECKGVLIEASDQIPPPLCLNNRA